MKGGLQDWRYQKGGFGIWREGSRKQAKIGYAAWFPETIPTLRSPKISLEEFGSNLALGIWHFYDWINGFRKDFFFFVLAASVDQPVLVSGDVQYSWFI